MFTGRPNTIRQKNSLYKTHLAPRMDSGGKLPYSINGYFFEWREKGLSESTIRSLLHLYKEIQGIDPKPYFKLLKHDNQVPVALTKDELNQFKEHIEQNESKFLPAFLLGSYAGLRRGEVLGLERKDVDFVKNRIHIKRSYTGPTKSGKERMVPLHYELKRVLADCSDKICSNTNPNIALKRVCKALDHEPIRFHDLRHTFATLALESNMSPKIVSQMLGHSNVSTTLNIYWAVRNEEINLNFLNS